MIQTYLLKKIAEKKQSITNRYNKEMLKGIGSKDFKKLKEMEQLRENHRPTRRRTNPTTQVTRKKIPTTRGTIPTT